MFRDVGRSSDAHRRLHLSTATSRCTFCPTVGPALPSRCEVEVPGEVDGEGTGHAQNTMHDYWGPSKRLTLLEELVFVAPAHDTAHSRLTGRSGGTIIWPWVYAWKLLEPTSARWEAGSTEQDALRPATLEASASFLAAGHLPGCHREGADAFPEQRGRWSRPGRHSPWGLGQVACDLVPVYPAVKWVRTGCAGARKSLGGCVLQRRHRLPSAHLPPAHPPFQLRDHWARSPKATLPPAYPVPAPCDPSASHCRCLSSPQ